MDSKVKIILLIVAVVLIVALVVSVVVVCLKKANSKAVESENAAVISTAIRAMADSTYRDLELAGMIYTVGLTKSAFIKDNFPESAGATLDSIVGGTAGEQLLKMVPKSLYGGKQVKGAVKGIAGDPSNEVKANDLKVGDLLFVKKAENVKNYIYDKDGLVDLSDALVKVDTNAVLAALAKSDIFAVFRPTLVIEDYDFITEKSPELNLSPEQEAVIETAKSYLLRGEKLQYADTRLSGDGTEFRWKAGFKSPEDCTADEWGFTNCAAFTYDVYYHALDLNLRNDDTKLYTTYNLTNFTEELGIRKYFMYCETAKSYTEEEKAKIEKEILDAIQPADILVVRRANGNGHAMLYIGNGNIIHSGGSVYDYNNAEEKYEASIRQMRFKDYFFTEGAGGYIFGSDTGANVVSFAIVRPLDTFEAEIPESTQNRVKNMKGIMAQKTSSHNSAKTVNCGEEMTFTFEIYNTNDKEVTLDVCDTVPSNTTYVSGAEKLDGENLSWKVTIPANSRKTLSYKVKVKEDAVLGGAVASNDSTVGGVPVKCPAVTINRTLNNDEQAKISKELEKVGANIELKGLELVNEIYKNAFGTENIFADTDFETVYSGADGVFTYDEFGIVLPSGVRDYWLNDDSKYSNILVPTLYGGRSYKGSSWTDRTRLAREHNLVVGDVLLRKTIEKNQVYIYAGEGKFYDLTDGFAEDKFDAKRRLETCLATGNCYAILRPSFALK